MSYSLRHALVVFIFAFCQNFLQTECETFRYEKIGVPEFVGSPGAFNKFLKDYGFGKNVEQFVLPIIRDSNFNVSEYTLVVRSVPEIHVPVEMDCEITVAGRSENCRRIHFSFRPSHDHGNVKKNLSAFCRQNSIVNDDCSILHQSVSDARIQWQNTQTKTVAVPYSYIFRLKRTVQHLLDELKCGDKLEWWGNTSIHTLLSGTTGNKVQLNYSACKFAYQIYALPEKIGLEEEAEAMASLNLTQFTFVLSSEITKELVTVLNLGMNTYLLAKARESDFFPPTDFQASMLSYAADLMEAVLEVEGRQRDAAVS